MKIIHYTNFIDTVAVLDLKNKNDIANLDVALYHFDPPYKGDLL